MIETLKERDAVFMEWLASELQSCATNTEVIKQLFAALTKWFNNSVPQLTHFRGCYFIKASGQCTDAQSPIFRYCFEHKQRVKALILQHMGNIDTTIIEQICLMKEGAIVTAYLNHDLKAADKCIPIALKLVS